MPARSISLRLFVGNLERASRGWLLAGLLLCGLGTVGLSGCSTGPVPVGNGSPDLAVCTAAQCMPGYCDDTVPCTGADKPHCDPGTNSCVVCLMDTDCPTGQVCASSKTCTTGCSAAQPCPVNGGHCEVDAGMCVPCLGDGDCAAPTPLCDPLQHTCFPCLPTNDACGPQQYCAQQGTAFVCLTGCKNDGDCAPLNSDGGAPDGGFIPNGPHCDPVAHACVTCLLDGDCPLGKICSPGTHQCTPGCSDTHGCGGGLTCCSKTCVDVTTDAQNCGTCGNGCSGGFNCCNAVCANPNNDVSNCGGCGNVCAVPQGSPKCASRICAIGACNPGWADCNGVTMDGCERHIDNDVNNCGGCGNACAITHAVPKCLGGSCAIDTCTFPYRDCDGVLGNGCETDASSDRSNCGGCGNVCSSNNIASPSCNNNVCGGACNVGYADCNQDKQTDGCETSTLTDVNNCGACGTQCDHQCTVNVQSTTCGNGSCGISACQPGYFDLDSVCSNGCECAATVPDSTTASTCATAIDLLTLQIGQNVTRTVSLMPFAQEAWYKVTFAGNTSIDYHPLVSLENNPSNAFFFDVYSDCSTPLAPSNGGCTETGTSASRTTWERFYDKTPTSGLPADDKGPNFLPFDPVGNQGEIYIRVRYNPNLALRATCSPFTLKVSN